MPKTLLTIGAGPGMSLATAQRFGREGWRIVLSHTHNLHRRETARSKQAQ